MILITGATGTNGRELAQALAKKGVPIRALVRNKIKAASLQQANLTLVEGDLDKPETLDAALQGVERAFLLSAVDQRLGKWNRTFISAAQKAGLKHLVKFSGMGALIDSPCELMRLHAETDEVLKASGVPYTILQPNSFYQNMLWAAGSIKAQGAFYLPVGQARQSLVDVADICAVSVKVLTTNEHLGKTYEITGPEALTYAEIAQRIGKTLGKAVNYVDVPVAGAVQSMQQSGMPEWNARTLGDLYAVFASGSASKVTDTVRLVTGKAPRSFDQFMSENVAAFE